MDIRLKPDQGTHSVLVRIKPEMYPKLQAMAEQLPSSGSGVATVIRMIVEAALEEGVDIVGGRKHPPAAETPKPIPNRKRRRNRDDVLEARA